MLGIRALSGLAIFLYHPTCILWENLWNKLEVAPKFASDPKFTAINGRILLCVRGLYETQHVVCSCVPFVLVSKEAKTKLSLISRALNKYFFLVLIDSNKLEARFVPFSGQVLHTCLVFLCLQVCLALNTITVAAGVYGWLGFLLLWFHWGYVHPKVSRTLCRNYTKG